jgi:cytochrome c-type biogenesis protein CcmH
MLLWVVLAVLTAITSVAVLFPLWRYRPVEAMAAQDVAIYKQQLQEIETERTAGFLAETEIEAARIEVSRRLLAASENVEAAVTPYHAKSRGAVVLVVTGVIALFSIGIYPFSAYIRDNVMRWYNLGGIFMQAGRYTEAAGAFAKVAEASDDDLCTPDDDRAKCITTRSSVFTNLGVAIAYAHEGRVTPEARRAFERAVTLNDKESGAHFWLGIADEQHGKFDEAATRYRKLLAGEYAESEKAVVKKRLEVVEQRLKGSVSPDEKASSGQGEATGHVSAADEAVIAGAVGNLAERLKKDGSNLTGWLMLVRSYVVLGRKDDAINALADARRNFAGNAEALGQIDALARELGLAS